jgi:hypothetical protein
MAQRRIPRPNGVQPGQGTHPGFGGGGMIGQRPHIPTDETRAEVRRLAKVVSQDAIAAIMDVSIETIRRHYKKEFDQGKAEAVAKLGAEVLTQALNGDKRSRNFYLRTQGARYGWSSKIEITGKEGGPIETVDLSRLTDEQLEEYGRLSAIAAGSDPDAITIVSGVVSSGEGEA